MRVKKSKETFFKYLTTIIILIAIIGLNIISRANEIDKKDDDNIIVDSEKWNEWQKEEYWEWHTRTTTDDKAYNGKHIVIENDVIDFYGYWKNSYKDFLYKRYENPGKKIFKFVIDESKANYHTLDGAGFIFNAEKTEEELSGYVLLFREKDVCIYRLEKVNIKTFETASSTTLETYGELIKSVPKTNSQIHNLVIEITPTRVSIQEAETELLNIELDYSKHIGESFGLISSYVQHACNILSKIEFSQIEVILEDYKLSILNTDMENTPIPGGYFELKNEKGEIIKEGQTDKDARFDIIGIKPGIYTIQQKKEPEGYILNETEYKFEITNEGKVKDLITGEEIELIIKNDKIKKQVDEENNTITNIIDNEETNTTTNIIDNKNNNTTTNIIDDKDKTISNIRIPNAGTRIFLIGIIIIIISTISTYLIIKLKRME